MRRPEALNQLIPSQRPRRRQFYQRLNRIRQAVQMLTLLLFTAIPILIGFGIDSIRGTLYALSVFGLDVADPLLVLQTILLTKEVYVPLLLAAAIPIALALIFSRVFAVGCAPTTR